MSDLAAPRTAFEAAELEFKRLLAERFPGADKYTWYRAVAARKGESCRRNDDTSNDLALAADTDIAAAHERFIRLLHVYYQARDGESGFLGKYGRIAEKIA